MRDSARKRLRRVHVSILVAAAGVASGLGLSKAAQPPQVEADLSARRGQTLTINGTNIKDGSVRLKDVRKKDFDARYYRKSQADKRFVTNQEATGWWQKVDAFTKVLDSLAKVDYVNSTFMKHRDGDALYQKVESTFVKGDGMMLSASKLVAGDAEKAFEVPGVVICSFSWGVSQTGSAKNVARVHVANQGQGPLSIIIQGGREIVEPGTTKVLELDAANGPVAQTVQILEGLEGDDLRVHSMTVSAYPVNANATSAQISAQILVGL